MYRHAIVALDLDFRGSKVTEGSHRALEQARDLARRAPLRVDLLHSTHGGHFVEVGEHGWVMHHEGLPDRAREALEAARTSLADDGVDARLRLREERPVIAITREVLETGADLVLMGKHNRQETGPRLGSVAARVLRKCPATVWVVKPDAPESPSCILVATDLGPVGAKALRAAADLHRTYGSPVHVFHAFQLPFAEGRTGESSYPELKKHHDAETARQVAEAGLEGAALHVGCTSPSRGIERAQEELGCDLVVMGSVGRGGVPGLLLGNTAERVLPEVVGSLLVVKPDDFVTPIELDD